GLELILPALFLASLFVSGWGWNAAWTEAEKSLPIEFRDEMYSLRFRIDPFMWGPSASRKGRRQYVATLGCFILGFACLPAAFFDVGYRDRNFCLEMFSALALFEIERFPTIRLRHDMK